MRMDFEDLVGQLLPIIIVVLVGFGTVFKRIIEAVVNPKSKGKDPKKKGKKTPSLFEEIRKQIEMIEGRSTRKKEAKQKPRIEPAPRPFPRPVPSPPPMPAVQPSLASPLESELSPLLPSERFTEIEERKIAPSFDTAIGDSDLTGEPFEALKEFETFLPESTPSEVPGSPGAARRARSRFLGKGISKRALMQAIVWREILGPPVGLKEQSPSGPPDLP